MTNIVSELEPDTVLFKLHTVPVRMQRVLLSSIWLTDYLSRKTVTIF